jgi:hypothetical protein
MSENLLGEYARLLTSNTDACGDLFAIDAEYRTRLGSHELLFRGRDDIRGFLRHVPRQIAFRAHKCERAGSGYQGELNLSAADLTPRKQRVMYTVENGRIKRFEILPH